MDLESLKKLSKEQLIEDGEEVAASEDNQDLNDKSQEPEEVVEPEVQQDEEGEYSPNYKYTAYDQEYEFDEELKPLIKNKKIEEKFRDIFTKAAGLDKYKSKNQSLLDKVKEYEENNIKVKSDLDELEFLRVNNPVEFCKKVGIDPVSIAVSEMEKENWSEQDKQKEQSRLDAEKELRKANLDRETSATEAQKLKRRLLELELDNAINNDSEAIELIKDYGITDLKEQVIGIGQAYYRQHQRDIAMSDAIKLVTGRYINLINKVKKPLASASRREETPKKTIPRTGRNSGSSASVPINSLDALRKIYKEKYGS